MFLIYDTQMIMGGKKHEISPEEHMFAAVQLYVDVCYIFLAILNLGGRRWFGYDGSAGKKKKRRKKFISTPYFHPSRTCMIPIQSPGDNARIKFNTPSTS